MIPHSALFSVRAKSELDRLCSLNDKLRHIHKLSLYNSQVLDREDAVQSTRDYVDVQFLQQLDAQTRNTLAEFGHIMNLNMIHFLGEKLFPLMDFFKQEVQTNLSVEEREQVLTKLLAMTSVTPERSQHLSDMYADSFSYNVGELALGLPESFSMIRSNIENDFIRPFKDQHYDYLMNIFEGLSHEFGEAKELALSFFNNGRIIDFPEFSQSMFKEYDESDIFFSNMLAFFEDIVDGLEHVKGHFSNIDFSILDAEQVDLQEYIEFYQSFVNSLWMAQGQLVNALRTIVNDNQTLLHFLYELSRITPLNYRQLPAPQKSNANNIVSNTGQVLSQVNSTIATSGYQIANLDMELKVVTNSLGEPVSISSLKEKDNYTPDQVGTMKFSLVKNGATKEGNSELQSPDVVGDTENYAKTKLSQYGFKALVQYRLTQNEKLDGKVIEQNPAAFSAIPSGSTIALEVGRYAAPKA